MSEAINDNAAGRQATAQALFKMTILQAGNGTLTRKTAQVLLLLEGKIESTHFDLKLSCCKDSPKLLVVDKTISANAFKEIILNSYD